MANHLREILNLDSWFHHNIKNLAYHLISQRSPLISSTKDRNFTPSTSDRPFNQQTNDRPNLINQQSPFHPTNQRSPSLSQKKSPLKFLYSKGDRFVGSIKQSDFTFELEVVSKH